MKRGINWLERDIKRTERRLRQLGEPADDSSEYPKPGMYDADTGAGSHLLAFFMGGLSGLIIGVVIGWLL